jgi:hypothetical protein
VNTSDPFDTSLVVRRSDVLWRSATGFLVVSTVDGEALQAGGPAPEIWERLDRPITIEELCTDLALEHGVEPEQIRADVSPFLEQLIEQGYVEQREPDRE